jgi:hypothetical protein
MADCPIAHLTSKMEFLDINLTKELNLLLHAINNSTGGFTEPFSSLVLKNLTKKSAKQENSNRFIKSIL